MHQAAFDKKQKQKKPLISFMWTVEKCAENLQKQIQEMAVMEGIL